jgi:transcriptional regulator with XRE-family HTH domain
MTTNNDFLDLITQLGWTLPDLQRETGLSKRQLSRYRSGASRAPLVIMRYLRRRARVSDKLPNGKDHANSLIPEKNK